MTGLTVLHLYNNYRLPRPVAKITQGYVGVDVMPYADKVYRNKEKTLPYFVQLPDFVSQMNAIVEIIKKNPDSSIGVLLHSNSLVEQTCKQLHSAEISFEYKFQIDSASERKVYGREEERIRFPITCPYTIRRYRAMSRRTHLRSLPRKTQRVLIARKRINKSIRK